MTLFTLLPILAFIPVLIVTFSALLRDGRPLSSSWIVTLIVCGGFAAWSLVAIIHEGPTGFWPIHTENMWGNQVWFDLLIALTAGWVLILPRARALNMKLPLWLLFILCSGSIGFLAMLARVLFLENRKT